MNGFFRTTPSPLVIGHRGVPLLHQENTLAGFRKTLELGIDGIEFDVTSTRDRQLVVFHDEDAERLTGMPGKIAEMSWAELTALRIRRELDVGGDTPMRYAREERIPLLEEVLSEFSGRLLMNIEIKAHGPVAERRWLGAEVARMVERYHARDGVVVTSFDAEALEGLSEARPELPIGLACTADTVASDGAAAIEEMLASPIGCTLTQLEYSLIDEAMVARCHAQGLRLGTFTLFPVAARHDRNLVEQHTAVVQRLRRLGVDWIETDDAERVRAILSQNAVGVA